MRTDLKLLEQLLDATEIFISIYDVTTRRYIKVNTYGLQMFDVEKPEQLPESLSKDLFSEEKHKKVMSLISLNQPWQEESLFRTQSGRQFWGLLRVDNLPYANNHYLSVRITNIDKFKISEQQARGNAERFKAVFEYAAIGILMVDHQGNIVIANRYMETLFGYEPDELIGNKVEFLLPDSLHLVHTYYREGYTKQPKVRAMGEGLELQGQHKNGSHFPVEVSLSYFYDKQQMYIVAFIQDITFKVQATRQLLKQKEAIEQLNTNLETEVISRTQALLETLQHLEKSKSELEKALTKEKELGELKSRFVSMASHEFRTPLSAILSSAILIGKYKTIEEQDKREKHIGRIQASVGFLTDILEEFLSLGRLEEGCVKAHPSHLNWLNLIEEITADLKPTLKKGQFFNIRHEGNATVFMDQSLIRKVLINLLSNAVKFSSEDVPVTVSSNASPGYFSVCVTDKGIGISDNDLKHLFERFFRGSNALNIQGTGLGLHIVGKYVELLNGKIYIQSELDEGTSVQLTFLQPDGSGNPIQDAAFREVSKVPN